MDKLIILYNKFCTIDDKIRFLLIGCINAAIAYAIFALFIFILFVIKLVKFKDIRLIQLFGKRREI